jgi:hypothetical protein
VKAAGPVLARVQDPGHHEIEHGAHGNGVDRDPRRRALVLEEQTHAASAGCIASVGTIMMAPLTALQALGFILLLTNEQEQSSGILVRLKRFVARRRYPHAFVLWCHDALSQRDERFALFVSVAWIASLFTALQALLFFPIVLLLLWRTSIPPWLRVLYFFLPIILLGAYMLRNPLLLASIGNVAAHDAADLSVIDRIVAPFSLWLFSGGIALSITGIIGMIVMRRYELLISLTLLLLLLLRCFRMRELNYTLQYPYCPRV